jgi:hypothetical protein
MVEPTLVEEKKGGGNVLPIVATVVGIVVIGGGLYVFYKKSKPATPIEQLIQKLSVTYNGGDSRVAPGQALSVEIKFTNIGTSSITPRFRVDIEGTGLTDTPLEGSWVASPSVSAGQSAKLDLNSRAVPTDWKDGKEFKAYVVLEGKEGHWDEAAIVFVVTVVGTITKTSVVYNNGQTQVSTGAPVTAKITWVNNGTGPFQPRFRVDIEGTGLLDSPLEGQWVTSPSVAPGQSQVVNANSIPVPTDWPGGKQLHAYVVLEGVGGHWDTSPLLTVAGGGGGAAGAVSKTAIVYNNGSSSVSTGAPVTAKITWKNTGAASIQPRFRLDIEGTGVLDSPLEGQWVTAPSLAAGQSQTLTISSVPVPTDWPGGKQLHAYVMLEGVEGHWDTSGLLTVAGGGGGAAEFFIESIVAAPKIAPPGPVNIATSVVLESGQNTSATIRCSVYQSTGDIVLGTLLWSTTKVVSFQVGVPQTVNFAYQSTQTDFVERDVKIEVLVNNQPVVADIQWDAFAVLMGTTTFGVTVSNWNSVLSGANQLAVDYWDPVMQDWVIDQGAWHNITDTVWIRNVNMSPEGGPYDYLRIYLHRSSDGALAARKSPPVIVFRTNEVINIDIANQTSPYP